MTHRHFGQWLALLCLAAGCGWTQPVQQYPTGNRVATGPADLLSPPVIVALPGVPERVAGVAGDGIVTLQVRLQDGRKFTFSLSDGELEPADHLRQEAVVTFPSVASVRLPDGRIVTDQSFFVALADPTDRYAHGILGDRLEAASIVVAAGSPP